MNPSYLADTSAWIKTHQQSAPRPLRERFDELVVSEQIAICDVVALELLHHEHKPSRFESRRAELDALPWIPIDGDVCARALEVQALLAVLGNGRHRSIGTVDYLIAAAAERAALPVLHYDADYERLAAVTGQAHEWITPRGSL